MSFQLIFDPLSVDSPLLIHAIIFYYDLEDCLWFEYSLMEIEYLAQKEEGVQDKNIFLMSLHPH
jgi:hypothetical protein